MGSLSPIRKQMDAILKGIIATALVPYLKPLGYRKKGPTFIRKVNDVCHVVNVQKDKWNEGDRTSFTVNIGVYSPTFARENFAFLPPGSIEEATCIFRSRIGDFTNSSRDVWWEFRLSSAPSYISGIASEIGLIMTTKVLPWLEHFQSDDKVLAYSRNSVPKKK